MKYPAPTKLEIAEVKREVGSPLPTALTALYLARGNGGFGPDYGLLGLGSGHVTDQGDTALSLYRTFNSPDLKIQVGLGQNAYFPSFILVAPSTTAWT